MSSNTLPHTLPRRYTKEDVRALRYRLRDERGWTNEKFANALQYSHALIKAVESGRLRITPRLAEALEKLEREQAYCDKEIAETRAETVNWLITALERRIHQLTPSTRKRLKKILEERA